MLPKIISAQKENELIVFDRVTKCFGAKTAVQRLTFTLARGEVVALLGHNGAGKTTTLRLAASLLDPTEGEITRPPQFKAQLGYLRDEPALFDYLTGREMLQFVAALYQIPRRLVDCRARHLIELFELERHADRLVHTYSRGMRRKLALVMALQHDPAYWLLDEPTEALDPVAARTLKQLMMTGRNEGRGILISTHQMALAESLCDRLVILHRGACVFDGPLAKLQERTEGTASLEDIYFNLVSRA